MAGAPAAALNDARERLPVAPSRGDVVRRLTSRAVRNRRIDLGTGGTV
jgi:hypothetical protein